MKILFLFLFFISCASNSPTGVSKIKSYNLSDDPKRAFKLSNKLNEISGLAMNKEGRLFGHNDESAIIYEINLENGKLIKSFSVGEKTVKKDFEGLAIVSDLFYLVTSAGVIYQFQEGDDGDNVDYKKYKTHLKSNNDVEGLCYDQTNNSLTLACKGDPGKGNSGYKSIYSFSLTDKKLSRNPIFRVNLNEISGMIDKDLSEKLVDFFQLSDGGFTPSGIEQHHESGTFFIISSKGRHLVEVSREGKILGLSLLNKKVHPQPEGITISHTNDLIISDEGGNGKARLAVYKYLPNN